MQARLERPPQVGVLASLVRLFVMPLKGAPENFFPGSVGVIGVGSMGAPMTRNLLTRKPAACVVNVFSRSPGRIREILGEGAIAATSPRHLASNSEVVIAVLPDIPELREVLFGGHGLIAGVDVPTILVVSSSVNPYELLSLDAEVREASHGLLRMVDAPVSGGTEGAEAGTLAIMVGGERKEVERVVPVLKTMGTPTYLGALGSGEIAKACNQMIVAATMTAVSEASVLAARAGLDVDALLTLLGGGYAASRVLETKHRRIVERDYHPAGAAIFMLKDLVSAAAVAHATAAQTPQLRALERVFRDLVARGLGEQDLAVVHRYIEELSAENDSI